MQCRSNLINGALLFFYWRMRQLWQGLFVLLLGFSQTKKAASLGQPLQLLKITITLNQTCLRSSL